MNLDLVSDRINEFGRRQITYVSRSRDVARSSCVSRSRRTKQMRLTKYES